MPGRTQKHVHWASKASVFPPPTPELSFGELSPGSSASSGLPITPPQHPHRLPGPMPSHLPYHPPSPYHDRAVIPLPKSSKASSSQLHPFIRYSESPPINYDLREPTSSLTSPHHGIPRSVLSEPATTSPTQSLVIVSPHLPWRVNVLSYNHGFITLHDLLESLHRTLRVNITQEEYQFLPSEKDRYRVGAAYEQRCRRISDQREYEEEKRRGVRRVDFLMGYTRFRGLSPAPEMGRDVYMLTTA